MKKFIFLMGVFLVNVITSYSQTSNTVPSTGNVGLGTPNPDTKLQVCGDVKIDSSLTVKEDIEAKQDIKVDGNVFVSGRVEANELWAPRIRTPFSDKIVYIGDSSVIINYGYNYISTTSGSYFYQGINVKGLSIAPTSASAVSSIATGAGSLSFGNNIQTFGTGAITLGKGLSGTIPLVNNDNFNFKVGFNSDIPTLTVTNSAGVGTTGNIGVGTALPEAKLHVHQQADPQVGGYGILTTSNVPTVKSISVIHKDGVIDEENFIVYTNGKVYCREVFVKLGVLGDFVFDDDYDLMNYAELENYLKLNHHLPGIPSEPEVLSAGLNVGEMQALVLQKTEENTLYILDLNKRLEALQSENEKLKTELEEMKKKQTEFEEMEKKQIELEAKINELLIKK